jgi:hypothetical protein
MILYGLVFFWPFSVIVQTETAATSAEVPQGNIASFDTGQLFSNSPMHTLTLNCSEGCAASVMGVITSPTVKAVFKKGVINDLLFGKGAIGDLQLQISIANILPFG